jgi:hypothetical protein
VGDERPADCDIGKAFYCKGRYVIAKDAKKPSHILRAVSRLSGSYAMPTKKAGTREGRPLWLTTDG